MIGRCLSGIAPGDGGDPCTFAGGVCSREDKGCLGESFDLRTLREMLIRINLDVVRCLEWIDLGQGPGICGNKSSLVGVEPKPSAEEVPSMPLVLASILGPPPVAHADRDFKGKAPMGSGGARAKFSVKPKTKISLKWKMKVGVGPPGSGRPVLGLETAKGKGDCMGQPRG